MQFLSFLVFAQVSAMSNLKMLNHLQLSAHDDFDMEDDDSLIQTDSTWADLSEKNDHFFNTVEGEDDSGELYDDADEQLQYDDAFIQIALQAHSEFDAASADKKHTTAMQYAEEADDV